MRMRKNSRNPEIMKVSDDAPPMSITVNYVPIIIEARFIIIRKRYRTDSTDSPTTLVFFMLNGWIC